MPRVYKLNMLTVYKVYIILLKSLIKKLEKHLFPSGEMNKIIHLTFTCSKSTIETLKKGVKYDVTDVVRVFLLLTVNIFHTFF